MTTTNAASRERISEVVMKSLLGVFPEDEHTRDRIALMTPTVSEITDALTDAFNIREPRQWNDIAEVPLGVKVLSLAGREHWGSHCIAECEDDHVEINALKPFTEILRD